MQKKFETYEQVALFLLNQFAEHFGLNRVEGKQILPGRSGTNWKIDGKGLKMGNEGFIIVECRRYTTSRPNQESLGGIAYRILDTAAEGGIIVTPLGIQKGAAMVANAVNIVSVRLDGNSTSTDYVLQFLNRVMIGGSLNLGGTLHTVYTASQGRTCQNCGEVFQPNHDEWYCPRCSSSIAS